MGVDLVTDGEEGEKRAGRRPTTSSCSTCVFPARAGLDVLQALRAQGFERPVLVLTAQDAVDAKVETLRAGADDYVTKPFAFEELLARVEALARRPRSFASLTLASRRSRDRPSTRARCGAAVSSSSSRRRSTWCSSISARHQGRVMSRTLITEYAWGYHFDPGTNIVDVVINHLRKKIDAEQEQKMITTVRGVGYVIKE